MSFFSKLLKPRNVLNVALDPAGGTLRTITNGGDAAPQTVGDVFDPLKLGLGGAINGQLVNGGALGKDLGGPGRSPSAPPPGAGGMGAFNNPFAMFNYTPGIGYSTGASGVNPFAGVAQSIPQSFFQSPQAFAALSAILNQPAPPSTPGASPAPVSAPPPTPPPPSVVSPSAGPGVSVGPGYNYYAPPIALPAAPATPGPAPEGQTKMGRVGGFGNGGGKMGLQGRWVRAL